MYLEWHGCHEDAVQVKHTSTEKPGYRSHAFQGSGVAAGET